LRAAPKHYVEYVLLRLISAPLVLLPYRLSLVLACLLAAVAHYVFRFRVAEAQARMREVFGDTKSPRERRRIAWIAWRNFVFSCVEMLRRRSMSVEWTRRVSNAEDAVKVFDPVISTGRGLLIATPHMGSWELAGRVFQLNDMGMFQMAARQKNPLVDAYWHELRSMGDDDDTVYRGAGALRRVIKYLKAGRCLAILPDLRSRTPALKVPFLGGTANVGEGVGAFARHADVPVFPMIFTRIGWTQHHFKTYPPIWPDPDLDKKADMKRITQEVLVIIDAAIQEQPEQWFWYNKRWILDPL